jgi:hypothetical protein
VPEVSVFVSYERSCRASIISFATDLERRRIPVRGDWQLAPGEDWWDRIANLIRGSDTFLFFLTPGSVRSPACLRELNLALSWRKRILPVVREKPSDQALTELPEALAKEQWVFLRPEDDPTNAFESIVTAVRTDFELAIVHTRLAIWTDAWEKRVGDLLRHGYLEEAEDTLRKMDARAPLLPSATPEMRLFVEESRAAERRRKRVFAFVAFAAIVILGLLSGIAWQKKRLADKQRDLAASEKSRAESQTKVAKVEGLRRKGESAVTAVRGGDVPGAVALLEEVATSDSTQELPSYHVIHRFLRPLLVPQAERSLICRGQQSSDGAASSSSCFTTATSFHCPVRQSRCPQWLWMGDI